MGLAHFPLPCSTLIAAYGSAGSRVHEGERRRAFRARRRLRSAKGRVLPGQVPVQAARVSKAARETQPGSAGWYRAGSSPAAEKSAFPVGGSRRRRGRFHLRRNRLQYVSRLADRAEIDHRIGSRADHQKQTPGVSDKSWMPVRTIGAGFADTSRSTRRGRWPGPRPTSNGIGPPCPGIRGNQYHRKSPRRGRPPSPDTPDLVMISRAFCASTSGEVSGWIRSSPLSPRPRNTKRAFPGERRRGSRSRCAGASPVVSPAAATICGVGFRPRPERRPADPLREARRPPPARSRVGLAGSRSRQRRITRSTMGFQVPDPNGPGCWAHLRDASAPSPRGSRRQNAGFAGKRPHRAPGPMNRCHCGR